MKSTNPDKVAEACVYFALQLFHALEDPENYEKAFSLFSRAAELGNTEGIFYMGVSYHYGHGVEKNIERAIELFEKAARKPLIKPKPRNVGVQGAQFMLGICYSAGVGKPIDYVESAKWFSKSSENGKVTAATNLGTQYWLGQGVEKNRERAIQYWKLGAGRGNKILFM